MCFQFLYSAHANIGLYQILLNIAAKTPAPITHFKLYQILLHIAEKLPRQYSWSACYEWLYGCDCGLACAHIMIAGLAWHVDREMGWRFLLEKSSEIFPLTTHQEICHQSYQIQLNIADKLLRRSHPPFRLYLILLDITEKTLWTSRQSGLGIGWALSDSVRHFDIHANTTYSNSLQHYRQSAPINTWLI